MKKTVAMTQWTSSSVFDRLEAAGYTPLHFGAPSEESTPWVLKADRIVGGCPKWEEALAPHGRKTVTLESLLNATTFEKLAPGELFDYADRRYQKMQEVVSGGWNAICIKENRICKFYPTDVPVTKVTQ